jgi:hypothetical protein
MRTTIPLGVSTEPPHPVTARTRRPRPRRSLKEIMPPEMGFDYLGMSYQEQKAREGIPASSSSDFHCCSCS